MHLREGAGRALLVGFCVAACLIYDPSAKAEEPKCALVLCGATVALGWWLWARRGLTTYHPAWGWGAAFVGWTALSALWGRPGPLLGNCWGALGLGLVVASRGDGEARRVVQATAILVAAASSTVVMASWVGGASGMALHAGQGNPNWLGLLLGTSSVLALGALLDAPTSRGVRCGLWATVALCIPALVVSESRVGWVGAVAGFVVLAVGSPTRKKRLIVAAVGVVFLAAIAVRSAGPRGSTSSRAARTAAAASGHDESRGLVARDNTPSASLGGRIFIQRIAAETALGKLPFGTGLSGFARAFLERQGTVLARLTPSEAARRFSNATTAHNDWIERAVESGPLGLVLLVGAWLLAVRGHWRQKWPAGAAALVTSGVEALGDSPLHLPAPTLLVALLFAALPGHPTRAVGWSRSASVGAVLLVGCAWLGPRAWSSWLGTRTRTHADAAAPDLRLALLEKSVRIDPWSGEGALALGLERLGRGDAAGALGELTRAVNLLGDVATFVAIGNARLTLDQPEEARAAYQRALRLNPGSARARINLSETLRRLGRLDQAETEARIALTLLPGDARLRELLDAIRERRMDAELETDPAPNP
jgi:tetratricopeptide (TPR) repeat protein